jgi:hypothetical protein
MKIIKKEDTSGWKYRHTCANCDSELEVEAKDLRYTRYDGDMREPGYDSYSAQCAVCSQTFNVLANKIPKLIQIEAKDRTQRHSTNYFDR